MLWRPSPGGSRHGAAAAPSASHLRTQSPSSPFPTLFFNRPRVPRPLLSPVGGTVCGCSPPPFAGDSRASACRRSAAGVCRLQPESHPCLLTRHAPFQVRKFARPLIYQCHVENPHSFNAACRAPAQPRCSARLRGGCSPCRLPRAPPASAVSIFFVAHVQFALPGPVLPSPARGRGAEARKYSITGLGLVVHTRGGPFFVSLFIARPSAGPGLTLPWL